MSQRIEHLTVMFRGEGTKNEELDPYVEELKTVDIPSVVIPVMTFQYCNIEILRAALENHDSFSGIIFTSMRSVQAVEQAFENLSEDVLNHWRKKINFSVGEATNKAAKCKLQLDTFGESSGNSRNLCDVVLKSSSLLQNKTLLFPCSSIRRETVTSVLQTNGIGVKEVICYDTIPNADLRKLWEKLVSTVSLPEILVFFSPSGVQFVSSMFKLIDCDMSKFKVVAIGPSTNEELCKFKIASCEVATKPTPKDLRIAVELTLQKK